MQSFKGALSPLKTAAWAYSEKLQAFVTLLSTFIGNSYS